MKELGKINKSIKSQLCAFTLAVFFAKIPVIVTVVLPALASLINMTTSMNIPIEIGETEQTGTTKALKPLDPFTWV